MAQSSIEEENATPETEERQVDAAVVFVSAVIALGITAVMLASPLDQWRGFASWIAGALAFCAIGLGRFRSGCVILALAIASAILHS